MTRDDLINEYALARWQSGDLHEDQEYLPREEILMQFREIARTLTDDQLVMACSSYALAE